MAQTLTVTEMARHFAEYINRVAYRGECFVLVRGNKPIAELRPVPAGKRLADLPGLFAALPHLSPIEAAQLADDLTAAREALARVEVHDGHGQCPRNLRGFQDCRLRCGVGLARVSGRAAPLI
jgi:antitoxin (DNA-binding transcriptional repressor) of toxin-antitoxin stability system